MTRTTTALLLSTAAACGAAERSSGGDVLTPTGVCASTLASVCPSAASAGGVPPLRCDGTWTEALADTAYCSMTAVSVLPYLCCPESPCGAGQAPTYDLLSISNVDEGYDYYYDAQTLDLVAIFRVESTGGHPCVAGPTDFMEPTCTPTRAMVACGGPGDGGAD
jgi:hypothetical protein